MKKIILFSLLTAVLIPVLVIASDGGGVSGPPGTIEELKEMLSKGMKAFWPGVNNALGQGSAYWQKIYGQIKSWWEQSFAAKFQQYFGSWWHRIEVFFRQRIGIFRQEFSKEMEEMKESIGKYFPWIKNNLWEKILKIIQR